VAQTTPYIGHPAYKKMGATWWYTLLTGILIGVCSVVGLLSLFVSLIPRAVIAPIFIFIGFEIMRQAYNDSPPAHSPAVSLSILPVIASLVLIILGQFMGAMGATPDKLPVRLQTMHQTLTMLSNGFIITGLLWGSMLAFLIDHKARLAALCSAVCAVLTLFGIIHSVMPSGELYLPWRVTITHAHYMLAVAYLALCCILLLLTGKPDKPRA
jgi:AGZA family xanthine/uracil permease-like MFS transporter